MPNSEVLSVKEACEFLRIKRTFFYELAYEGRLNPLKLGRRTLVRKSELIALLESLPKMGF
ncbi:MAG: helix-turn-helix domain-containing protein [Xanthobacteraceae bacterium]|jgi:excisionase family DNA binding protein|nr:helix-turn-helix domain-containing protein [Xanthobacteraceae bacterium]MBX3519602.1 helix-turn-helix domain-containing protein [Xanthobacteraceae bacterium]MBX3549272.1 helix-turn-helix domain-containing protein [Xanthobacteraceae bacterium]